MAEWKQGHPATAEIARLKEHLMELHKILLKKRTNNMEQLERLVKIMTERDNVTGTGKMDKSN